MIVIFNAYHVIKAITLMEKNVNPVHLNLTYAQNVI